MIFLFLAGALVLGVGIVLGVAIAMAIFDKAAEKSVDEA